jgi:hypothetical protein
VSVAAAGLPASSAQAAGVRPVFQLPFSCKQTWAGVTRHGHSPNASSLDLTRVGGVTSGEAILASADGLVSFAGWDSGGGWMVNIKHANGWGTSYLHMIERPPVSAGQNVSSGQQIGRVGSTGDSSGPRLHYQQWADSPSNTVRAEFNGTPVTIAPGSPQNITSHNSCERAQALNVLAVDESGQLVQRNWHPDTGWSPWWGLGGSLSSAPAVAATVNGDHLDLFARGADDRLYQMY